MLELDGWRGRVSGSARAHDLAEGVELTPSSGRNADGVALCETTRCPAVLDVQRGHQAPRDRRPDAVEELQHPEPTHLVPRIFADPQHRERVLHVRALEELQAAILHERDVATR